MGGVVRVKLNTSYRQMLLAPLDDHPVIPVDDTALGVVGPDGRALNVSLGIRDGRVWVDVTTDPEAELEGASPDGVLDGILAAVPVPR